MSNPFLSPNTNKHLALPFDKIKSEHFIPAIKEGIRLAKEQLDKIKSQPEAPDFKNTIEALETSSELLDTAIGTFYVLFSAEAPKELQALAGEISQLHSEFASDVNHDEDLFRRIKTIHDIQDSLGLTSEQRQLLDKSYKSFVRNGALVSEDKKERLRELDQELATLSPKFSQNVLNATNAFELLIEEEGKLSGLPQMAKDAAAELAEKKGHHGKWMFSLQAPSLIPALTYLNDTEIRKTLWLNFNKRCFHGEFDNQEIVLKIVRLKDERAKLLGYKNHADYVLEERMAQSAEKVESFLDRLLEYSKKAAAVELEELADFMHKTGGHTGPIDAWDFKYYEEKLKQKKFHFDQEELRPYFQLENVYKGAFELVRRLYGIVFREINDIPKYHPDVETYEVLDEKTGQYIGLFYMDFFPRETKRGGAWMTDFRDQGLFEGKIRRPHIGIVMNFTKPTKSQPSLLNFDEMNTFFHEFGHALHGLLSSCTYRTLSGTHVYWDFVELPSQFMENWVLEKDVLDLFAVHYKTGEKMPGDLFQKLKNSSKFMAGNFSLRQLNFGILDLKWHTTDPKTITDVDTFEDEVTHNSRVIPRIKGTNISTSFSHIFAGGYAAGYYSYKWAEVLDADAFEYFKEHNLFNKDVANKFKENILMKGGTEHPMELYKKFRGREPDPDALLRRDGLL